MGNKVNPIGMRLQVNRTWDSRWYADTKDYGNLLLEDLKIRDFIKDECKQAGVARVIIERPHKKCRVTIHTARPGVIIGKKGADIETLRKKLAAMTDSELHLNIVEIRKPEVDAQLRAATVAQQRLAGRADARLQSIYGVNVGEPAIDVVQAFHRITELGFIQPVWQQDELIALCAEKAVERARNILDLNEGRRRHHMIWQENCALRVLFAGTRREHDHHDDHDR